MLTTARDVLRIPVFPMLRPRGGDFTAGPDEFAAMCTDLAAIRDLGFPGFVFGVLRPDRTLDPDRMITLLALADGMDVTFHRAFDVVPDPVATLAELAELGVRRVLTSGQAPDAISGAAVIAALQSAAPGITLMPGGGVRPGNVGTLITLGARGAQFGDARPGQRPGRGHRHRACGGHSLIEYPSHETHPLAGLCRYRYRLARLAGGGHGPGGAQMAWQRFVAIGDSFTEGLDDPAPDGRHRGWADRTAERLAEFEPSLTYANLAIRGRKLAEIVAQQIPVALDLRPDLVSFAAGVNDVLRPQWNQERAEQMLELGVRRLRRSGADVMLFTFGDPSARSRTMGMVGERLGRYRDSTLAVAQRHDCYVVDFWAETLFNDERLWAADRLHLSAVGHDRASRAAIEALGLGDGSWREPLPPAAAPDWLARLHSDLMWTSVHFWPWVARRIVRRSSGDGIRPKRPILAPVTAAAGPVFADRLPAPVIEAQPEPAFEPQRAEPAFG